MPALCYWLPCNQVNFVHAFSSADRGAGRDDVELHDLLAVGRGTLADLATAGRVIHPSHSVLRRAIGVLYEHGFSGHVETVAGPTDNPKAVRLAVTRAQRCSVRLLLTSTGLHCWEADAPTTAAELREIVKDVVDLVPGYSLAGKRDLVVEDSTSDATYQGLLPFFQLNLLLSGLQNPAYRPDVFFGRADDSAEGIDQRHFSVSLWDDVIAPTIVEVSGELTTASTVRDGTGRAELLDSALARFARFHAETSLLQMKWRVERARRALLEKGLNFVHRQGHLVQLRQKLDAPERFDKANEAQLRGYVMLVSAKLPLLENVRGHVDFAAGPESSASSSEALAFGALVEAIGDNLGRLETAIEHAWMEQTLYEQEQARAEQEALAEIERARARGNVATRTLDSPIFAVTLVIGAAAFFASASQDSTTSPHAGLALVGFAVGLGLYAAVWAIVHGVWWYRRAVAGDARHYFEFNLRLDLPLKGDAVQRLMAAGEADEDQGLTSPLRVERRGSFRVERTSNEDAIFKLHVEGSMEVLARSWRRPLARQRRVTIFGIYEVLSHQPSGSTEYVLRELRATVISDEVLSRVQLRNLNLALLDRMVDAYAETSLAQAALDESEPSATLTVQHPERASMGRKARPPRGHLVQAADPWARRLGRGGTSAARMRSRREATVREDGRDLRHG